MVDLANVAAVLLLAGSVQGTLDIAVDCEHGSDSAAGTAAAPFRTLARAQQAYRAAASLPKVDALFAVKDSTATVTVSGLCELDSPLVLDDTRDSGVNWIAAEGGAVLSGGTKLDVDAAALAQNASAPVVVDLGAYNFTSASLGSLAFRGYAGGSACILVNNFEPSGAELFFRPSGVTAGAVAAAAASGDDDALDMRLARFPNRAAAASPATTDWLKVDDVKDHSLTLGSAAAERLDAWNAELQSPGGEILAHGLWQWNWADSHRPVLAVTSSNGSVTVGDDDINRDVGLIKGSGSQGGNLYLYNLMSELDAPGEYYINRTSLELTFRVPRALVPPPAENCWWNVTVSRSDGGPDTYVVTAGTNTESFVFDGSCSGSPADGPMGVECVRDFKVARGARLLKRLSDMTVVGQGVCCNDVTSAVAGAVRLNCTSQRAPDRVPNVDDSGLNGTFHVSRLSSVVIAQGVSNILFRGFEIRHSRGGGVVMENCSNVVLDTCTIANHGMMGLNITGGSQCGASHCDIYGNGDAGAVLLGGNRTDLTPSEHFVRMTTAHSNQRWIMNYAPNVMLAGVGQQVTNSEVYNSPQIGLFLQGNDHVAQNSTFHHLAQQCSDCGGFYAGRDWTYRGNALLNNVWHSINPSIFSSNVMTIYLDDQLSSVKIAGNIFDHTGDVLQLGGGRHNEFTGNILNGSRGIAFDDRGGGGSGCAHAGRMPFDFLARVPYATSAAWAKYPDLKNLLSDEPCLAKYNNLSGNTLCGGTTSIGVTEAQAAAWGSYATGNAVGSC